MKRAAWLLPCLLEGSGGHRTIIQNAQYLADNGYICDLYIEDNGQFSDGEELAREVERLFGPCTCGVRLGFELRGEYDVVFATAWYTAPILQRLRTNARKAYFVQDLEALFNPMSDGYLMAMSTYSFGLHTVTIGRWLSGKLRAEYGASTQFFDFCCDKSVYHPLDVPKENALCFICQPEKPRRCFMLGLKALEIVKRLRPEVKIYFFGSKCKQRVRYEHEELGLLSVKDCNALYNRCRVGLCLSSTNPSRVPFEMMAAGLPVVDLYMENNLYDMPDGAVHLAYHTPEAIAEALIEVLDSKEMQQTMSEKGRTFMRDRPLEYGFRQFLGAVENILAGTEPAAGPVEQSYHGAAVEADASVQAVSDEIEAESCSDPRTGLVARLKRNKFLRRSRLARKIWTMLKRLGGH